MDLKFPYEITNLAIGPIRVAYADPTDVPIPTKMQDLQALLEADDYALETDWHDFGAAINPASYSRSNTQNDLSLLNETTPIDSEVTGVARSAGFNVAEISPESQKILENAPTIETIAAVAGVGGPQKRVPVGQYNELPRYRIALIGQRKLKQGIVQEPAGGPARGRFFAFVINSGVMSGDAQSMTFDRSNYASGDVTFVAYPDEDADPGEEHGGWIYEDAAVIAAGP